MPGCKPYYFSQELLVDLTENVRREHREFVRTIRIIEMLDNVFEGFIVDGEPRREGIGSPGPCFFFPEMKEPRVIPIIRRSKGSEESRVDVGFRDGIAKVAVLLDPSILADAEENQPVYRELDRIVYLSLGDLRISQRDIPSQEITPALNLGQESIIYLSRSSFGFVRVNVLIKGACQNGLL